MYETLALNHRNANSSKRHLVSEHKLYSPIQLLIDRTHDMVATSWYKRTIHSVRSNNSKWTHSNASTKDRIRL